MSLPTSFTFNNGAKIPAVGLGCWMGDPGKGDECYEMCLKGLKMGYRHLDTAAGYDNEEAVGRAIRDSDIPRQEIFVTTKLSWAHHGAVQESLDLSLKKLGLDYIDLLLIHWPRGTDPKTGRYLQPGEHPTFVETWQAMEALLPSGKVKSIGVSNFSIKTLEVLLPQAKVIPVTNQVEAHPALPWNELLEYCKSKNILVTAYSPLGRNPAFFVEKSPEFKALLQSEGLVLSQALISWAVQRGTIPIPKSIKEERLRDNFNVVKLSDKVMSVLDNFHKIPGVHGSMVFPLTPDEGSVFGWTFDDLGWGMDKSGKVIHS